VRLAAVVLALSAVIAAGARASAISQSTCPHDASLGVVRFARGGSEHVVSLANCRDRVVGRAPRALPSRMFRSRSGLVAAVRTAQPKDKLGSETITVNGRAVYRVAEDYRSVPGGTPGPLSLSGWSPDSRWLFFSIDPMSSASLAADGLEIQALNVATRRVVPVTTLLLNDDYMTWCGSTLVLTAGEDRLATTSKRLVVATAPAWKPRVLWRDPKRAFSSVACAPDGKNVAVLSQTASLDFNFFHTKWQLWQVSLDGSRTLLDTPPAGSADESPRWSRDGKALLFVREHKGYGQLMLLRNSRVTGPIANLGYSLGYYGHHDWWQSASWSASA
jgi:dipeptidyl aminopeptidase/acylaminoacyl peptidase